VAADGVDRVVNKKVQESQLRRVKLQVFQLPTWAISGCRLEVQLEMQLEVDAEHAKDMFQV